MLRSFRLLSDIVAPRDRLRLKLILALLVVAALFEVVGIAAIFPFLQVLSNPELVGDQPLLAALFDFFGFATSRDFTIFLGATFFILTLAGIAARATATYALTRFALMQGYGLSRRLIAGYLAQPYSWFLDRSGARLGRAVLSEVDKAVVHCILPALLLVQNLTTALAIALLLMLAEPLIAIGLVAGFLIVYTLIYRVLKPLLTRIGASRVAADDARFRIAQEAFAAIKEVKLMGLEERMVNRFTPPARLSAHNQSVALLAGEMPRFILEALLFGGMILLLALVLIRDSTVADMLPTLGLVAVAGVKLYPQVQRAYYQFSQIRYYAPALEALHHDLRALPVRGGEGSAPSPVRMHERLELRNVSYAYPGTTEGVVKDVSLQIERGARVGIVGGSGAGKTTLVDIILGLLQPQAGQVLVDGMALGPDNLRGWQQTVGYVPQSVFLADDTVAANIAFGQHPDTIDMDAVAQAARAARLHDFVGGSLPAGYDTGIGERGVRLSGGQRQRIGIARALYGNPDVLIFDEATSALDNLTESEVMDAMHQIDSTKTVIMIAHRLSTVRGCDRIFLVKDGRLEASGTYDELMARSSSFRRLAGNG